MNIPNFLYHATFEPYMKSIGKIGLTGTNVIKTWSDSEEGVVYLANTPEESYSYAETSDDIPMEYLNQIVVLEIHTKNLDPDLFYLDSNNLDNNTFEYRGNISPENIFRMKD